MYIVSEEFSHPLSINKDRFEMQYLHFLQFVDANAKKSMW